MHKAYTSSSQTNAWHRGVGVHEASHPAKELAGEGVSFLSLRCGLTEQPKLDFGKKKLFVWFVLV